MVRVLVAYATRMGSTAEIAAAIADTIAAAGLEVDRYACALAPPAADYDAVIVGSALYIGHWHPDAVGYLRREREALASRPCWLFHSGPVGEGAEDEQIAAPRAIRKLATALGTVEPVTFGGLLDRDRAPDLVSRWVATGSMAGDYRDWDRIHAWARDVAARLQVERTTQ